MQNYLLDRQATNVFLQATTCTRSTRWFDVDSSFIGWKFSRHRGKIHRFTFKNLTIPQLINVSTFSNVWINKSLLNRTTLSDFKIMRNVFLKKHIHSAHPVDVSAKVKNKRYLAPPRK